MLRYLWLLTLAALFSVGSYFVRGWLGGFLSNLGAGFVGSLLTVMLIDRTIEKARMREKIRIRRVAFDRLRSLLFNHILFLFSLHKASVAVKPASVATTIEGLFNEAYYESLPMMDFGKPAPVLPTTKWVYYASGQAEVFRTGLERTADLYMAFLDTATIELIEKLVGSNFLHFLVIAKHIPDADRALHFDRKAILLGSLVPQLKQDVESCSS